MLNNEVTTGCCRFEGDANIEAISTIDLSAYVEGNKRARCRNVSCFLQNVLHACHEISAFHNVNFNRVATFVCLNFQLCREDANCLSFEWQKGTGKCELFDQISTGTFEGSATCNNAKCGSSECVLL